MKFIKKFFKILIITSVCAVAAISAAGCKLPASPKDETAIKSYGGYEESLFAEWEEANPENAKAYYKESSAGEDGWVQIDAPLIRSYGEGLARVDALGLKAGDYNVKIVTSAGKTVTAKNTVKVTAYDRSGYAHFHRQPTEAAYDGVGAYRDDGTLKDGTLIVYVTEDNKNDISDSVYLNGEKFSMDGVPADGAGIGHFLSGGGTSAIYYLFHTYTVNAVSVRFIGKVNAEDETDGTKSLIDGLVPYSNDSNGKTNGRYADIIDCKNVTLEGVGADAEIYGWGFNFYARQKSLDGNAGSSFEVRNLTFKNYPEDAIGMEGRTPYGDNILSNPVERCWIHDNSFYKGYCKNPSESDKAEGDGSVDFKRGRNYTLSYNYFEETNKTCLIGGNANNLQFNVTFHHNWWNKSYTRKPLIRRANLHFYNNYIQEDINNGSYVASLRANCYMFSEANYFEGCNNIARFNTGSKAEPDGHAKAYQNAYFYCRGDDFTTKVENRDEKVENYCQYEYESIDYTAFDTDADLFYYKDGQSDCFLEDAVSARQTVMKCAGVRGTGKTEFGINKYTPATAVKLNQNGETVIALQDADAELNGILFRECYMNKKGLVIAGQSVTFTLAQAAYINITENGGTLPQLVRSDGKIIAQEIEDTLTAKLEAGTYFICACNAKSNSVISYLSFEKA